MSTTAIPLSDVAARPLTLRLHEWVTTVDHKRLGILYVVYALIFLLVGGVEATIMRIQLTMRQLTVGPAPGKYRFDAKMRRTSRRPLAAGRLHPSTGLWFGTLLSVFGAAYLLLAVNSLASLLAVVTLGTYLFVYTPLKRKTPLSTLAGAFPGAMPPLIGWVAAGGSIASAEAWILYSLLFLWQFPHFMAIAWMYREDYARAGYFLLPQEHDHTFVAWLTAVPSLALVVVSVVALDGTNSILQYSCAVVLGLGLLYYAARLILFPSRIVARQLLKASIIYLPLELLMLIIGKS